MAALTLASVPVNVMVTSAVPSPAVKLRPVVWARVSVPWLACTVACTLPLATSVSAMAKPAMPRLVSSSTL